MAVSKCEVNIKKGSGCPLGALDKRPVLDNPSLPIPHPACQGLWLDSQLSATVLHHLSRFSTLSSLEKVEPNLLKGYVYNISNLLPQFDVRFKNFEALRAQFQVFSTLSAVETESVAEE